MTLQGLYVHTAEMQTAATVNINGRLTTVWETVQTISCRITQPGTSKITIIDGAVQPRIDAVIFADISVAETFDTLTLPVRFVVADGSEWSGTYEAQKMPRIFAQTVNATHIEIDVERVTA